ncbi:MAG: type II toxin-antitoxin system VapB family antitoxin [Sphingobacteriaceae bacterium]|nr:MAG: type II toxin-antitoxin system VapB family antitoxin [Sphingobacteriaceae bacterium]
MRTNIEIDDALMEKALKAGKAKTKKQVVEEALKLFVKLEGQKSILAFKGKVKFFEPADDESFIQTR